MEFEVFKSGEVIATLTTESCRSRHGIPVLRIEGPGYGKGLIRLARGRSETYPRIVFYKEMQYQQLNRMPYLYGGKHHWKVNALCFFLVGLLNFRGGFNAISKRSIWESKREA